MSHVILYDSAHENTVHVIHVAIISGKPITNHGGHIFKLRGVKPWQQGHVSVTISSNDGNEGL